jgi:hypothetical protein
MVLPDHKFPVIWIPLKTGPCKALKEISSSADETSNPPDNQSEQSLKYNSNSHKWSGSKSVLSEASTIATGKQSDDNQRRV